MSSGAGADAPNLYDLIAAQATARGDAIFIEVPGASTFAFSNIDIMTRRILARLLPHGVSRGDRVVVQVEKSPEAIFVYLACLRAGLTFIPLNTAYQQSEVAFFLEDARPAAVICRLEDEATITGLLSDLDLNAAVFTLAADGSGTLLDGAVDDLPVADIPTPARRDAAAILYSSGTTGRPKGAVLSHANLAANAETLCKVWGFTNGDVLLHALPIFHTHGLFVAMNCALLSGSKVIFCPRFDVDLIIGNLPKATVFMGVPTFYTRLLSNPAFDRAVCQNMRLFISGSAPLLVETFNAFEARTGFTILERYGMTEGGMFTSNPLDGERKPGTVGPPLPGVSIRIVDDEGAAVPQGEVGSIQVKGENIFNAYLNLPEKSKSEFTEDGYFRTGDLGRFDEDGYVQIIGRDKDMIISGGFNVYPKEIEDVIDRIGGVDESAVVGLPHPDFGEAGLAVVVPEAGASLDPAEIAGHLRERLANYKVPKHVVFVGELPRNTMGKVQKNVLREQYLDAWKDVIES